MVVVLSLDSFALAEMAHRSFCLISAFSSLPASKAILILIQAAKPRGRPHRNIFPESAPVRAVWGSLWAHFGLLGYREAVLRSCEGHLGQSWAVLEPSWGRLRWSWAVLGSPEPGFDCLGLSPSRMELILGHI